MDQCGQCFSSPNAPGWNAGLQYKDTQGRQCPCFSQPRPCAGSSNITTCTDACPSNLYCPGTTTVPDSCGLCPGNSMYGKTDKCGICCNPSAGIACNQDVDDCGVCFGFNKQKNLNPCHICIASQCHIDCKGVANGTATYDCAGICGGNSVCQNTTTPGHDAASNTGKIIGGVIGGLAALAFLVLAAFFALKYAQSAGLLGHANKQVDLGASNTNPLYKSEVNVQQNPLYQNS